MKSAEPHEEGYSVQDRACVEYGKPLIPSLCIACVGFSSQTFSRNTIREKCRFIGFRRMRLEQDGSSSWIFNLESGVSRAEFGTYEYYDWNPSQTAEHIAVIKVWLTSFFSSVFYIIHSTPLPWLCCPS
jgi:hypothetical protein